MYITQIGIDGSCEMDQNNLSGLELLQRMLDAGQNPEIGKALNFQLFHVESGKVIFTGAPGHESTNPMGTVHGGWYGAVLDSAMACSVITHLSADQSFTTLEYKVNIIRPIPIDREIFAEGYPVHVGRRTAVAEGKLYDRDHKIYAVASTTGLIISTLRQ